MGNVCVLDYLRLELTNGVGLEVFSMFCGGNIVSKIILGLGTGQCGLKLLADILRLRGFIRGTSVFAMEVSGGKSCRL